MWDVIVFIPDHCLSIYFMLSSLTLVSVVAHIGIEEDAWSA